MLKVADYIDGCFVEIYERSVKNEKESDASGVATFDNKPYVRIKPTNSRDTYDQPINSEKKLRYSALWASFQSGEEVAMSGTPVEEWSQLDAAQVQTLKSAGILTVQALAEMSESGIHRLPAGYITLKQKAADWLGKENQFERAQEEIEKLRDELNGLRSIVNELVSEVDGLKKKPGRPRKVA